MLLFYTLAQEIFESIQIIIRPAENTKITPPHMLKFNFFKYLYARKMFEHTINEVAN
jgi:hypothetical protein